ncbi:MAG: hydrogenase [Spirochaetes bacterium]|nr:MAG: hydrogenase [Spirochaetota bacterium]
MGILALLSRDLLKAVLFLAVLSLLSALLFFHLHAPDVALTEAAVGTGLSTFLYIWLIRKVGLKEDE